MPNSSFEIRSSIWPCIRVSFHTHRPAVSQQLVKNLSKENLCKRWRNNSLCFYQWFPKCQGKKMWNSRATVSQNSRIRSLEFPTEPAIPSFPTTLALSSPTPFLSPLPAPLTASEAKTETQLYTTLISIHYDLGDKGTRNAIHSEHIINSARSTWDLVVEKKIFANHIFSNVQARRLLDWIKNLIWTFLEDFLSLIISLYQVLALTFLNFVLQKRNRINDRIVH